MRALLLPGFNGRADQPILVRLSQRLAELGFEPERHAPPRSRPAPGLEKEVGWLRALLDGPCVLVGRSFGGRVAVRLAADPRVEAVVLLGFPVRPPGRPRPLDEAALAAAPCPTLVVQGSKDELGPLEVLGALARKNRRLTLHVLEGAGHGFGRHERAGLDAAVAWLAEVVPRRRVLR